MQLEVQSQQINNKIMIRKNFTKKIKLEVYKDILSIFINNQNTAGICKHIHDALEKKGFSKDRCKDISYYGLPEIDKEMKRQKRTFYLIPETRVKFIKKQIKLLSKELNG